VTQRWWQTERSKYGLFISEVVEVECARGDPELAARRRSVLSDVVLFPIDEKDTEISKKNDDTGTNSGERRPGRREGLSQIRRSDQSATVSNR
jgi:hypothetical protein